MVGQSPEPAVEIDLGGSRCSLQAGTAGSLRLIRALTDAEAHDIEAATAVWRVYLGSNPFRLLLVSANRVEHEVRSLSSSPPRPPTIDDLFEGYVSWLLLFQMTLDQWKAEIDSRFGKESAEATRLRVASHQAYDRWLGYRIAAGVRDRVAHRSLPPLTATGRKYLDSSRRPAEDFRVVLPVTIHEIVVDGDTAFAITESKGEVTVLGPGITAPEANRELFVFVREAGDWKIGRYMFNKTTAA